MTWTAFKTLFQNVLGIHVKNSVQPVMLINNAGETYEAGSGGGGGGGTVTVTGAVEIANDSGSPIPVSGTVTVANPTANPETGLAKDTTLTNNFGADGATPPAITGTGIRGWLRGIYEKVAGTLAISAPRKLTVGGTIVATSSITYNNLLDDTVANGNANTDVRDYQSGLLYINGSNTVGTWIVEGSPLADFTTVFNMPITDVTNPQNPIIGPQANANSQRQYFLNLQGVNYLRVRTPAGTTGVTRAYCVMNQSPNAPAQITVQQANSTLLNTQVTGTVTANLNTSALDAHSGAVTGRPVPIGGRVQTAVDTTLIANDASFAKMSTDQQLIWKPYQVAELDFSFLGTINNSTTANPFKNAGGANIRNYLTGLTLNADTLGGGTDLVIRDGNVAVASVAANVFTSTAHDLAIGDQIVFSTINTFTGVVVGTPYYVLTTPSTTTFTLSATPNGSVLPITGTGTAAFNRILFRTRVQNTGLPITTISFPTPIAGMANATMDIQATTAVTGSIYYNARGYVGF